MRILEAIRKKRLFFDGGTGSILQAQGLRPGELPETWNIYHKDVMVKLHRDYLEAGCDVIKTNTFGANRLKFNQNTEYGLEEIVVAGIKNAREAVTAAGHGYIAMDVGPTGKLLPPLGDLAFENACEIYREVVEIGVREGVDLILIETMSDSYEMKAAVLSAKERSNLPVFVTMMFDEKGKLLTGGNVESTVALLEGLRVDALGINCGLGPAQMKDVLKDILRVTSLPVIVNPNAGLPRNEDGRTVYDIDADCFSSVMEEIVRMGASMVGGCCGTTPLHISKTVERCRDIALPSITSKARTVISSYSHAVEIGGNPILIGERINPTGRSEFKQALREHNLEYILREGVTQQANGAHVLDVNVGLPEINEPSILEEVVCELQSMIDLPLQIDTSNIEAMGRAMRIYNGKPLINSVNGKQEVMEQIFPLVKRYGGVVVALTLDEEGIPETPERRVAIAEKIYKKAKEYGINKEDIIIDALCMAVSSDSMGALTTLETLRRVRDELGGKTILGISNISYGLPQREIVNAAFFTMALQNGLNAAIINPNSEAMMGTYDSFRILSGLDRQCAEYIHRYSDNTTSLGQTVARGGNSFPQAAEDLPLSESIEQGLNGQAHKAAKNLLKEKAALTVINEELIPALDRVGRRFEQGTVFLPQLLMSAEAANAAFEEIKDHLAQSGEIQEKKGMILLATVQGDTHDIGKNIVKVLLENYNYDVIDLGTDAAPEKIVKMAVEHHAFLVGLSALMTTTVPSMETTIRFLRKEAPWIKVMVGGAVMTEEYADTIGADRYCKDAMASVNYVEQILGYAGK